VDASRSCRWRRPAPRTSHACPLVVFLKRPGGQSQFSNVLAAQASDVDGRFSALHAWIIENIASNLKVETLAEKAGMSPRTFARAYASRTGWKPRGCCSKAVRSAVWLRWRSGQGSATTNACGGLSCGTSGYLHRNSGAAFRFERQSPQRLFTVSWPPPRLSIQAAFLASH
jgi:hypothetical protein